MPPQSRAQRRRQAARQQQQRRPASQRDPEGAGQLPAADADESAVTGTTIALGASAPVIGEARRVDSRPAARCYACLC